MKNTNIATYLFKAIPLLILDIVTFMLVFSVWSLVNIQLFPWAFCAIIFSLIMINIVVLVSKKCIQLFGIGVYASAVISTFLYYVFVMIYTGVTYINISPKWYLIATLTATLLYVLVVAGLYIAGMNKNKDMAKQEIEHEKVLDMTLQLMTIDGNIKSRCDSVERANYVVMNEAFNDMNERLKASTPFGRITKIAVLNLENQIFSQLFIINDNVVLLDTTNDNQKTCELITRLLREVKALIINREKLIIQ